jgi:hypothetical protein
VREALGDPELVVVLVGEDGAEPLAEVWRRAADVYGDIPDRAARDRDELCLRLLQLIMQSSQGAAHGAGMIVLDEGLVDPRGGVARLLPALEEEPARVAEDAGLDEQHAR